MGLSAINMGTQALTKYGKLLGTSKNGIKVYEQLLGNGTRKLTSLSKDGNLFKKITTRAGRKHVYGNPIVRDTNVINHTTGQNITIRQARSKSEKYYNFERTVTILHNTKRWILKKNPPFCMFF